MDNNIENKKPDVNSSEDFEVNDKTIKNISDLIHLKGLVEFSEIKNKCIYIVKYGKEKVFGDENKPAKYLYERFKKRFNISDDKWHTFNLNAQKIVVEIYQGELHTHLSFENEFEAIEYLKSLYIERLWDRATDDY